MILILGDILFRRMGTSQIQVHLLTVVIKFNKVKGPTLTDGNEDSVND